MLEGDPVLPLEDVLHPSVNSTGEEIQLSEPNNPEQEKQFKDQEITLVPAHDSLDSNKGEGHDVTLGAAPSGILECQSNTCAPQTDPYTTPQLGSELSAESCRDPAHGEPS